ncbi:Nucleolar complex protein 2 [Cryptosporidium hominis]|uniref:Nucleolar complex protein 2 n=1 Tax=Cryptosporidium hominis TaxID=237895 RepID=A0ABX5BIW4_CRYHO|nr:Nucleolar complex protein 2 [Cryptosporidium hominis]|eukprot:PPS97296.1 Nucleolar complex protein 2 [Cryptosporidium hominis]
MSESDINLETSRHLEELKQLKEVDYEFYKYLEEHGQDLLDPVGFKDEPEDEVIQEESNELGESEFGLPKLDKIKFREIVESLDSKKSFKSLSLLLSCFRSVTSINAITSEEDSVKPNIEKNKKSENKTPEIKSHKKERCVTFQIDDPELMFEITIYVLGKIPYLFWYHSSGKMQKEELNSDIIPESLPNWTKIEKICKFFWQDLSNLILNNCLSIQPNLELMQNVFKKLSDPLLILWIMPNRLLTNRFSTLLSRIWTMNKYILLKQGAFQVLRTINARFEMISQNYINKNGSNFEFFDKNDIVSNPIKMHEEFLLILHRTIGISAMRGISWKNYISYKQIINDYVLLLQESNHNMVYRIAYNVIRRLGSMLRILYIRISRTSDSKNNSKIQSKGSASKKKLFEEVFVNLFSWKFLTFIRIWSLSISNISQLYPLQYPLVTIITSVTKLKLNSIPFLPFTLQNLEILTEISISNKVFIPLSEMLFDAHSTIERGVKLTFNKSSQNNLKTQTMITTSSKPFMPEFEIKIGNSISKSHQVYDSLFEFWAHIVTLYISSLFKHPSFPEFLFGIIPNLKKLQKHNSRHWNDNINRIIKEIIKKAETHSEYIKNIRTTILTNQEFLSSVYNQNTTNNNKNNNLISPYSSKLYCDYVYNSLNSKINSEEFLQLENYIIYIKNQRTELIKGKIKLSSMKAFDNSDNSNSNNYHDFTLEDEQEDLEFKILLQQLQKAGKSINDIKNLGPRQLKKLKKSIRSQMNDIKESTPLISNQTKPNKRSSITRENQESKNNKRNKSRKLESENSDEFNTKPNTNEVCSNIIQNDIIEYWDINSEDDSIN